LEKAVTAKSGDLDALLFGLDIENRSYDFYRRAAVETTDALGKAVFEFLAGEERGHFDILMMRYQYLTGSAGW
jgi:rubrerythrin